MGTLSSSSPCMIDEITRVVPRKCTPTARLSANYHYNGRGLWSLSYYV